jgi:hypothetical protein
MSEAPACVRQSRGEIPNKSCTQCTPLLGHGEEGPEVSELHPGMILPANESGRRFVYTPTVYSRGLLEGLREMRREASVLKTDGTGWDVGYGELYLASDEAR